MSMLVGWMINGKEVKDYKVVKTKSKGKDCEGDCGQGCDDCGCKG